MLERVQLDNISLPSGMVAATSALVALVLARLPKALDLGGAALTCRPASVVAGGLSVASGGLALGAGLLARRAAASSASGRSASLGFARMTPDEAVLATTHLLMAAASGAVHGRELERRFSVHEPSDDELAVFYPIESEIRECEQGRVHIAESIGGRPSMEDSCFMREEASGLLLGVFDGHRGSEAACYLADAFPDLFFTMLNQHPDWSPYRCLQSVVPVLDERVCAQFADGTTAIVSFVTKDQIFTLTLGDASADLYHAEGRELTEAVEVVDGVRGSWMSRRVTPLSPLIDWSYAEERARVQSDRFVVHDARIVGTRGALNVSRAFGDRDFKPGGIGIEPFITVVDRPCGDGWRLILGCDGWKDGLNAERQGILVDGWDAGRFPRSSNLATLSAYRAICDTPASRADNTTVMAFVPRTRG